MVLSIDIPDKYPLVLLCNAVLPSFVNFYLSSKVIVARKKFKIPLPNLYATPGVHEKADEFNRVQRGHQNIIETISDFKTNSLIAGLYYPKLVAVCGLMHCVGAMLYQVGYSDTKLDVRTARLRKGGPLKFFALMTVMFSAAVASYNMCKPILV